MDDFGDAAPDRAALGDWFDTRGRDLPWRHTRDPWAVLVAEVMLTQTRVARVVGRWEAFVERFPTPAACADDRVGAVIEAWAGLGYNRRAVNLHRSATRIVTGHRGTVPDSLDALTALPGVGPYVARAVLAFAFERDVGVVDVNVLRVFSRRAGRRLTRGAAQASADAAVPPGEAWRWNQAMLDLGATVCTKRNPRCDVCPVVDGCVWRGVGDDPAEGTSSRQSRFEGSDRQGRGRMIDALRRGPVRDDPGVLAEVAGWSGDPERATRVAATLVSDGLAIVTEGAYRLP